MKQFSFRPGFHNNGHIDPEKAYSELERIRQQTGSLTTHAIVDEARPDESPIHPHFEWDDWKAAEAYRRNQAGQLVRAVVVSQVEDSEPQQVYARVHLENSAPEYMPVEIVVKESRLYESARGYLLSYLNGVARTLRDMEKMAGADQKAIRKASAAIEQAKKALGK